MKIMNTTIILTTFFALLVICTLTLFTFDLNAFAQIISDYVPFHTLKEVLQDREIGDPIICPNPAHVLVLRPNSNWTCVYFETAKHLNWDIVLYSVPDAPQITTSIFYQGDYHYITYQTNEGTVDSIKHHSDVGYNIDNGYVLEISVSPTQEGNLTVILPSIESDMFENYCVEFNGIPDSHYYFYLLDGVEVDTEDANFEEIDSGYETRVKLPYNEDSKVIEIAVACLI